MWCSTTSSSIIYTFNSVWGRNIVWLLYDNIFIIFNFMNISRLKYLRIIFRFCNLYLASLRLRSARCPCRTKLFLKFNLKTYFCIFHKLCAIGFHWYLNANINKVCFTITIENQACQNITFHKSSSRYNFNNLVS